jgi:hypothetical protein
VANQCADFFPVSEVKEFDLGIHTAACHKPGLNIHRHAGDVSIVTVEVTQFSSFCNIYGKYSGRSNGLKFRNPTDAGSVTTFPGDFPLLASTKNDLAILADFKPSVVCFKVKSRDLATGEKFLNDALSR